MCFCFAPNGLYKPIITYVSSLCKHSLLFYAFYSTTGGRLFHCLFNGIQSDAQVDYPYGEAVYRPDMQAGNPIRLDTLEEIKAIFAELKMNVLACYADFGGTLASDHQIQLMVCSEKQSG